MFVGLRPPSGFVASPIDEIDAVKLCPTLLCEAAVVPNGLEFRVLLAYPWNFKPICPVSDAVRLVAAPLRRPDSRHFLPAICGGGEFAGPSPRTRLQIAVRGLPTLIMTEAPIPLVWG